MLNVQKNLSLRRRFLLLHLNFKRNSHPQLNRNINTSFDFIYKYNGQKFQQLLLYTQYSRKSQDWTLLKLLFFNCLKGTQKSTHLIFVTFFLVKNYLTYIQNKMRSKNNKKTCKIKLEKKGNTINCWVKL